MAIARHFVARSALIADAGVAIDVKAIRATATENPFKIWFMGISRLATE
jgi:hypothetical protein